MASDSVRVRALTLSSFALDGGAMHGIVPRVLWERVHPADASHRIPLVARALLVEHAASGARTLIELGLGQRWSERERERYAIAPGPSVRARLALEGIDPDTVTHVVLTHLHWDHAGGMLEPDGSVALPRAQLIVSARALAHARAPSAKDDGSFRADVLDAIVGSSKLQAIEVEEGQEIALCPGVVARGSEGHTPGLLVPIVPAREDGPPIAFPTDLVPTRSHLKLAWVPAYDVSPARSVVEKEQLFADLARRGGGVVFYHDPLVPAAWARTVAGGVELVDGELDGSIRPPS